MRTIGPMGERRPVNPKHPEMDAAEPVVVRRVHWYFGPEDRPIPVGKPQPVVNEDRPYVESDGLSLRYVAPDRGVDRMADLSDVRAGLAPRQPKQQPHDYRYRDGRLAGHTPTSQPNRTDRRITKTCLNHSQGKPAVVQIIRGGEIFKPLSQSTAKTYGNGIAPSAEHDNGIRG